MEACSCPPEYKGQFCEQCASGYVRVMPSGGPYVTCVPSCECNGHSDVCDADTGVCINCQHNTAGTCVSATDLKVAIEVEFLYVAFRIMLAPPSHFVKNCRNHQLLFSGLILPSEKETLVLSMASMYGASAVLISQALSVDAFV